MLVGACKKKNDQVEPSGSGAEGHYYVDLGLPSGIKWATCNVGASKPEEYGFYYAWGETTTKGSYGTSNYLWYDQTQEVYTKYTWDDNVVILEPADDAATVNWGGNWRMPTQDELAELKSNCNWLWTTQDNINGWRVKGPNGNSIFLPAAGSIYDGHLAYVGEIGCYWTSSLGKRPYYEDVSSLAACLIFSSGAMGLDFTYRVEGLSVRPVYSGKVAVSTSDVSHVSYYSATCGGYVSSGSSSVKARGVCWSTSQYPTTNDACTSDGIGVGAFTSNITGLIPNTKYFVRAYAINEVGVSYGSQISFVTKTTTVPTVTIDTIMGYTETGVIVGGSVADDGGLEITERGFCWGTKPEPTTDNKVSCGSGSGSYVGEITGFEEDNKYYVRAFATNSKGTSYGDEMVIEMWSGIMAGYPYVDLGLPSGTLWAMFNVGTAAPEGYGGLFAWGESETKDDYSWQTYKWCEGSSNTITKYCIDDSYGTYDGLTQLEPEDDVATVKWGSSWHMPTYDEMQELFVSCNKSHITYNGVNGLQLKGPNGRSIFMPVDETSSYYDYYWINDIEYCSYRAECLRVENQWNAYFTEMNRCSGCHVRPVVTPDK